MPRAKKAPAKKANKKGIVAKVKSTAASETSKTVARAAGASTRTSARCSARAASKKPVTYNEEYDDGYVTDVTKKSNCSDEETEEQKGTEKQTQVERTEQKEYSSVNAKKKVIKNNDHKGNYCAEEPESDKESPPLPKKQKAKKNSAPVNGRAATNRHAAADKKRKTGKKKYPEESEEYYDASDREDKENDDGRHRVKSRSMGALDYDAGIGGDWRVEGVIDY